MDNYIFCADVVCDESLTERLEQELKGIALVPLDGGTDLQDLSPLGEAEIWVALQHCSHLLA
jgi:hypothetical protein